MGYKLGQMYLTRVEHQQGGAYLFTFFLDSEGNPTEIQERKQITGDPDWAGYFDRADLPNGPALNFTLADNQTWMVAEVEDDRSFLIQNAPQDGYYVQVKVYVKSKQSDLAVQLQGGSFASLDGEESDSDFTFDYQVMSGYRIQEEDITELSYQDCFDLEIKAQKPTNTKWAEYFYERYVSHALTMWLASTQGEG